MIFWAKKPLLKATKLGVKNYNFALKLVKNSIIKLSKKAKNVKITRIDRKNLQSSYAISNFHIKFHQYGQFVH